jgi:hypothetical protein
MRCPSYGFENPAGMTWGGQLGSPLGWHCPQYGFENPPGFARCGLCVAPLTNAPSARPPSRQSAATPWRQSYPPTYLAETIWLSRTFGDSGEPK